MSPYYKKNKKKQKQISIHIQSKMIYNHLFIVVGLFGYWFLCEIKTSLFAVLVYHSKVLVNLSTANPLSLAFG